jgi:hypothetical protein
MHTDKLQFKQFKGAQYCSSLSRIPCSRSRRPGRTYENSNSTHFCLLRVLFFRLGQSTMSPSNEGDSMEVLDLLFGAAMNASKLGNSQ